MPDKRVFSPDVWTETVTLSVEEYETVRLLDYEGLTQQECARQMGVARVTVTNMYAAARQKLAQALVTSRRLVVAGGSYALCEKAGRCCGQCGRNRCRTCQNTSCANHPGHRGSSPRQSEEEPS